ncbi:Gag-Pol polyprotein [Gossypium australe]|uniref:Gag-Pol polyprotein n=1 Tax=Gossypium australe TaxID=47621 RepID=A0A5B6VMX9_9ROSI|nr:Gag-Pol polyprotein [Gossypium australe]
MRFIWSFSSRLSRKFDELDVILGMDRLTLHDAAANCRRNIYILNTTASKLKLEIVLTICKSSNVFLEELSRLPSVKDVQFAIELVSRTSPILITLHRMGPTELKKLKA